jgi:hypothetical protein
MEITVETGALVNAAADAGEFSFQVIEGGAAYNTSEGKARAAAGAG